MPDSVHRVLSNRILRVEAGAPLRRSRVAKRTASHAAIFAGGDFLGVTSLDGDHLSSQDKTYGDLLGRQRCIDVPETTLVEELGRLFEDAAIEALIVRSDAGDFVGTVTRQSLLDGLLNERSPAEKPAVKNGAIAPVRSEQVLSGERQFLECLLTADSPDGGLTELIQVIESLSDGMICSILLLDEDGERLRSGAAISLPDEYVRATDGIPIGPNVGSCGTAAFLNEKVIVTDIDTDPLWAKPRALALKHGLRSCWSVPIRSARGNVLGTFAMYYTEPRSPDAYHEHLIDRAVHMAAIAIERRRTESAIEKNELRFRTMFESVPECVKLLDADGNLLDMNATGLRLIEADSLDQVRGISAFQLVVPEYQREFRDNLEAVFAGESNSQEFEIIGLRGARRWMETYQVPLRNEQGEVSSLLAVTRDITERKRSDDLLQALVEGTAGATGADFFASFTRALARVFKSRYIVVCEHIDSPVTRTRTLAFWMHDRLGDNIEYDVAGGPCEETANGRMTFYPSGIQELFPEDKDLVEMHAESYCGIPLADSSGRVIGHLALLDDRPMNQNLCDFPALPVFVARAASELERLRAERSLRENKQRLKAVISDLPVIITTVNQTGDVTLFDGRGLDAVGFWPGQFVGRNYFDLWRERRELTDSMRECLRGGVPAPTTIDVGDRRIETRYSPIHNSKNEVTGAITVCVDVTERVRAENEVREKNYVLEGITRLQQEFLVDADPHQSFDHFLSFLLEVTESEYGFIAEVLHSDEGVPYLKSYALTNIAWDDETREFYEQHAKTGLEFNKLNSLYGAVLTTGETVIANDAPNDPRAHGLSAGHPPLESFLGLPSFHAGEMVGVIGLANRAAGYDEQIIEKLKPVLATCASLVRAYKLDRLRKQAEEDARRHRNDLAHVSRVSTMGEMATGIAHEINQPLAAIAAYSETAKLIVEREYPEADDLPDMLGKLKDQAIRAGRIVERLRSYIKKSEPVRTSVDLHSLVKDVARFVDPDIQQAGVALQLNFEEPSPTVLVDEIQIQQVLVNLVRNAIDAMRDIPYEHRKLTMTSQILDERHAEVFVCDSGDGLSSEDLSEVFEAFYTTKQEGMGMGLPISRSIVESHGGKLWAKPNESTGMTFGFSIPWNPDI